MERAASKKGLILSSYKVNYSELVIALQEHEQGEANQLLQDLLPRLKTYLMVVMEASTEDAEEAAHRAFFNVYEKIMQDEIRNKKYIYKYILKACRYEYIKMSKYSQRFIGEGDSGFDMRTTPAGQIENLLDEDRQEILRSCLQELSKKSREYITYILDHPTATTKGLSEHFKISQANARVKKSRIINALSACVKKKWIK